MSATVAAPREHVRFHIGVSERVHGENRLRVLCGVASPDYLIAAQYATGLPDEEFCERCKAELDRLNDNK